MWDAAKQWKNYNFKYIFGKEETSHINDLIFYFKKLGSKEQFKHKIIMKKKESIIFKTPKNEIKAVTIQQTNEIISSFFAKGMKIFKL